MSRSLHPVKQTASTVKAVDFAALGRTRSRGHAHARGIRLRAGAVELSLDRRFELRPGELYSVGTIAAAVGYGEVSQLNRQFRQLTGASPGAWRRANRLSR